MKTNDYSIDQVNKAIRNNLFARVEKYTLAPIDNNIIDEGKVLFIRPNTEQPVNPVNPFAPRDNGRTVINLF